MKVQINTNLLPIFSGTYGTLWGHENIDHHLVEQEGKYPEYKHEDLMNTILMAYQNSEDIALDTLPSLVKTIKFTGHYSPREYNFATDQLDFEIKIDKQAMLKKAINLIGDSVFKKWLRENYKSRSGFISYTPSNIRSFVRELVLEGDEFDQTLSALIRYLTNCNDIEEAIYEKWQGNYLWDLEYKIKDA